MKKYFSLSIQLVNQKIFYVFLVTILSAINLTGINLIFLLLESIITFSILIVIYGRFIEQITGKPKELAKNIFNRNWINYIAVCFIVFLPIVLGSFLNFTSNKIVNFSLQAIIAVLSIYIFPLIFLTGKGLLTIQVGLNYLFKNLQSSVPLMLLAFNIVVIKLLFFPYFVVDILKDPHFLKFFLWSCGINFALIYLNFVVFCTAGFKLTDKKTQEE
ncbi:MAG: hypothetical protein KAJ66_06570 [Candidatus Omnitrophica bacterium]|nr:hypothetical protein [Candidatus Omnitrophota bacterium]